ncbi:CU044_2847 family protein [Accumulibacter sp.]|uniref:CU044_2847 family protein n=1 Tax=Accumulibacter sp. TaxID=2053492 RepID=UPI0025D7A546|nr:CU044_2847 family protein [Accumulibacter sp.]MCM8595749.1 hypothetical protein [Accumulibacter sp.]MCM8626598.1 hypothetical protein [Accumulibacter sp.]MDS4049897.1 CU044_2847 family protein [Accumulibacter sp.]
MPVSLQQIEIDGQPIWVEVAEVNVVPVRGGAARDERFAPTTATSAVTDELARVDLSATLAAVVGPVRAALDRFTPDEVTLELALGLKAEVGVFVAKGEANAQVRISAKWKPAPAAPTSGRD